MPTTEELPDIGPHLPKDWEHLFAPCSKPDCRSDGYSHGMSRISAWYLSSLDLPPVVLSVLMGNPRVASDASFSFLLILRAAAMFPEWAWAILRQVDSDRALGPVTEGSEAAARYLAEYFNVQ